MNAETSSPKVSVCVITYNHALYIEQCLRSIFEQETDFPFEIIVGDDLSTDATRDIILEIVRQSPVPIRTLFHENKVGGTLNHLLTHEAATGTYIAHVDGDDFCLPGKLQAQVQALEADPAINLAAHAVYRLDEASQCRTAWGDSPGYPEQGGMEDLLRLGTYFTNSSIMYRSCNRFPHAHGRDYVDFYFHIEHASRGRIYFDRTILGCYRVHATGMSKSLAMRAMIEQCYEEAFDRAEALGVRHELVQRARLKKRMGLAIDRYLMGDAQGYQSKIRISALDSRHASWKHRILHYTRHFPFLIQIYFLTKRVKNV